MLGSELVPEGSIEFVRLRGKGGHSKGCQHE